METKTKKAKFSHKITPQTLKQYEKMNVYFTIPRLVAYYEYNHGNITPAKRIMYYRNPTARQYPIDLNADFETYVFRESCLRSKYIELSLKYEMKCNGECRDVEKTKVITRRGTLVHIMEACYYKQHDMLSIRVSRYNGNIYMVRNESLSELKHSTNTHHGQLEKLLFSDSPDKPAETNKPCDENNFLLGVHRSNFGKYDIIYSGEIQGIISQEKIKDFDDLEALNNCRFVFTKQMWKYIKYEEKKYLNYWLQSYLANVKDIYIGYKNKNGIIEEPIKNITTRNLPKNCFWKPSVCLGFLYDFLQNVEKHMSTVNCLNTVYMFHYNSNEKIFSYEIFKGKTDKTFITEEYMEYYKN
ncbi:decapping nuclease DXO homolog [Lucilia cuprina]|uniref:decapping nuclease DXO homolog n=1 Tax=Lucilia cuprina TaxID=7375 RepID=UPI001F05F2EE|nr:decapping nuclease DXO homolog [Lucilia cuprina]XP_046806391.1 decapping nuclease DXO homolog [Lucilia cuprina]